MSLVNVQYAWTPYPELTVNVGAGYRLLLNDWIALRVDFRDHIFDSDLQGNGNDDTTHNLEATGGISFFF